MTEIVRVIDRRTTYVVPLSKALTERWTEMRQAINRATEPFTGKAEMPLSIFHLHDMRGADEFMDQVLVAAGKEHPGKDIHGSFTLTANGPGVEVSVVVAREMKVA